jgi:ribonuclease P protein component
MFATRNRFHGTAALRWVYKGGQQARGRYMAIRVRSQRNQEVRVAVVVSRKVSKSAVVRNRIRRRLYEVIRTKLSTEATGLAIVVTVYDEVLKTLPIEELRRETERLLLKARAMSNHPSERAIVKREGE